MQGNVHFGTLIATITNILHFWLECLGGPRMNDLVFGSITWGDLGVSAIFIIVTVLANGVLIIVLRRHTSIASGQTDVKAFLSDSLRIVGKPIYLLLWIYGLYFAFIPLLLRIGYGEGWRLMFALIDKLLDIGFFVVLLWFFFRFTHVLENWIEVWVSRTPNKLDDFLAPLLGKSLRIVIPVLGFILMLPLLDLHEKYTNIVSKGTSILMIVALTLILLQMVSLGGKAVLSGYDIKVADNLQARKRYTQINVISKTLYFMIILFTLASVMMLFKEVQRLGTSILASAGVIGIVFGFAAQKTIANLFAGFQLAMTQPIRLDDVVIVDGEWGRIEEMTLTYVVVHIWDDRRLVVPLNYFIEKPFQNWTRTSADILGSIFVWVDYSVPLEKVRAALKDIIENDSLWDKRFWNLQVTEASERSMQIRVLATSADSSKSWDLRCNIREKLIAYLQCHYPQSLPKLRTDLGSPQFMKPGKGAEITPGDLPCNDTRS